MTKQMTRRNHLPKLNRHRELVRCRKPNETDMGGMQALSITMATGATQRMTILIKWHVEKCRRCGVEGAVKTGIRNALEKQNSTILVIGIPA